MQKAERARRRKLREERRVRNEIIEEVCLQLEGLPYHVPGVRLEMARLLRRRLKTHEEKSLKGL